MANEGIANLAAALMAFFGGKYKARKEEQREKRKEERESIRARENREFLKEMEKIRGTREEKTSSQDLAFKEKALEKAYPTKGILDKFMDSLQGALKGPSPQDQLAGAQAGLYSAQADLLRRNPAGTALLKGTGGIFPGNPKMPKGRTTKPPKPTTPTLMDPASFLTNAAKNTVTGIKAGFRAKGRTLDPERFDWYGALKMKQKELSDLAGEEISDDQLKMIESIIRGGEDVPPLWKSFAVGGSAR